MSVLTRNQLIFQQTKNFSKNDFSITDPQGLQLAHVVTGGSALGRAFAGPRELTVLDGSGSPIVQVKDTVEFGRDRMDILDGAGNSLARLVKRATLFKTRVTVEMQDEQVDLQGKVLGFDFHFIGRQGVMATVSRQWSGAGRALLGNSTYSVAFDPALTERQRQTFVGCVLALDLIREKQNS